MGHYTNCAG